MLKNILTLFLLLVLTAGAPSAFAAGLQPPPRGIYVVESTGKTKPIPGDILKNPDISAAFLPFHWDELQPAPDQYNWQLLDSIIAPVVKAGKKYSIAVGAGKFTPAWVYQQGLQKYDFIEIHHEGKGQQCNELSMPAPWEDKYVQLWGNFVNALAAHLREHPDYYAALANIKVSGVNRSTVELRIPAEDHLSNKVCTTTEASAIWAQAGYRPQLLENAVEHIIDIYAAAFPDKYLNLDIIPQRNALPKIDERGRVGALPKTDYIWKIIQHGLSNYKDRFIVQFDALTSIYGKKPSQHYQYLTRVSQQGGLVAFQLESVQYGVGMKRPGYSELAPTPASAEDLKKVFDVAKNNHALYTEVFTPAIRHFPDSVHYGSELLK